VFWERVTAVRDKLLLGSEEREGESEPGEYEEIKWAAQERGASSNLASAGRRLLTKCSRHTLQPIWGFFVALAYPLSGGEKPQVAVCAPQGEEGRALGGDCALGGFIGKFVL